MSSAASARDKQRRQDKTVVDTPAASDQPEDTDLIETALRDEHRDSDDDDDAFGKSVDAEGDAAKSANEVLTLLRGVDPKLFALLQQGHFDNEIAEDAKKRKIAKECMHRFSMRKGGGKSPFQKYGFGGITGIGASPQSGRSVNSVRSRERRRSSNDHHHNLTHDKGGGKVRSERRMRRLSV